MIGFMGRMRTTRHRYYVVIFFQSTLIQAIKPCHSSICNIVIFKLQLTLSPLSTTKHVVVFNPCPAELLQLYFSSFESGIANAISIFK